MSVRGYGAIESSASDVSSKGAHALTSSLLPAHSKLGGAGLGETRHERERKSF
jgi:hypothetical protein